MSLMLFSNFSPKGGGAINLIFGLILFVLVSCFLSRNLMRFYFMFEAVLIPIFLVIMGWGYQPERLRASLYIFFYTLCASLPLLLIVVVIISGAGRGVVEVVATGPGVNSEVVCLISIRAFLVKFPIYLFHLWLPKAHVEAPVSGSIVLAGILLKLGGFGVILFIAFFVCSGYYNNIIRRLSVVGRGLLALIILRVSDIKVAIAYSSVVHIRIIIVILFSMRVAGAVGGVWIIVAHGLASSGIFRGANMMYERSHSRRLIRNKGVLRVLPFFRVIWFLLIIINFAGPFTLNLYREILIIGGLVRLRWAMGAPILFMCFFSAAYNLHLFAITQQGILKVYYGPDVNLREGLALGFHILPGLILLGGLVLLNEVYKF